MMDPKSLYKFGPGAVFLMNIFALWLVQSEVAECIDSEGWMYVKVDSTSLFLYLELTPDFTTLLLWEVF